MASATFSRADCSAPDELAGMALLRQKMLFIEETVQDLEIKMNSELDWFTKDQIALREEDKRTTDSFVD